MPPTEFDHAGRKGVSSDMRRVSLVLMVGLGITQPLLAQGTTTLTQIRQVVALTNAQAASAIPVQLEGTVTAVQPQDSNLFIQDEGWGIYVDFGKAIGLLPGDRVRVSGTTAPSFRPQVEPTEVKLLSHGLPPAPKPATMSDLIQAKYDSTYVTVTGRILSATLDDERPIPGLRFHMQIPDGIVEGVIINSGELREDDLIDATVRVSGAAGGAFDSKMQMAGVWLDVQNAANVTILSKPSVNPWALPSVPVDQVIWAYRRDSGSHRVRITGTLTYYESGTVAVVEADGQPMLIGTGTTLPLKDGMVVEATGFPEVTDDSVWLNHAQLRSLEKNGPIAPQPISFEDASEGKFAYNLVSMEGTIVAEVRDARVDLFVIESEGHLFSSALRHLGTVSDQAPSAVAAPSVGSRIRVAGVCFVDVGNHWRDRMWFTLRMRSMADMVLLQAPPFWTIPRMMIMVGVLGAIILCVVGWVWLLRKRVRKQTMVIARKSREDAARERQLAQLEQQRSRILEMISRSETLPEVMSAITSMVAARLDGSPCWFELDGEDRAPGESARATAADAVSVPLVSRDGKPLGRLLAQPAAFLGNEIDVPSTLRVGARLGELAIDTRRLLEDLRHRSEHDLLTGIANRFSMERELARLLLEASQMGSLFGLIYIDLDFFKQVNDQFGHRTGDVYLQRVTQRMKAQLRNGDMLARIGGDEFVALTAVLRSREDAEEIADRIRHCFDEPFEIEGAIIRGSASVGLAIYPRDGSSKEALQRAADVAMYAGKQERRARVLSIREGGRR